MSVKSPAIEAFLEGVRTGDWQSMGQHYSPAATFKGTVPRWYFTVKGASDVTRQMADWFPCPAVVRDLYVNSTDDGAVVEFERRWTQPGDGDDGQAEEVGIRQAHVFYLDPDGRIREQHGHCAGIWDAATFAEAAQANALAG